MSSFIERPAVNARVATVLHRFDPIILRHSGIWRAADEAVLNNGYKKEKSKCRRYTLDRFWRRRLVAGATPPLNDTLPLSLFPLKCLVTTTTLASISLSSSKGQVISMDRGEEEPIFKTCQDVHCTLSDVPSLSRRILNLASMCRARKLEKKTKRVILSCCLFKLLPIFNG
jgi:hypothetical protein